MRVGLFLDSGAHTIESKGGEVSLQEYIDFVKKNQKYIDVYANLDVLGDPKRTWENQWEMERQGLSPLPVYHVGEPNKYLHMAMEYSYFGIGGAGQPSVRQYDSIFALVCPKENNHYPVTKVHGFGMTRTKLLTRYPWFSVDSSSWLQTSAYGAIYVPRSGPTGYDYTTQPLVISVTSRIHKVMVTSSHVHNLSEKERAYVVDYIESCGYGLGRSELVWVNADYELAGGESWLGREREDGSKLVEVILEEGVSNKVELRYKVNAWYFLQLQSSIPEWPWPFVGGLLIGLGAV